MTSDAKGNVQQQFVWTRSSIIEYLKSAGLEDVVAEELSKQFLNSQGGVDYEASSAQKRWAGKYGTLAEALGKVAEYSKYDEAGQIQAADIVERAKRDKELRERQRSSGNSTASTSPALVAGASGANGSTTYVSHITLPNGSKTTVKFADAASQSATEQLLRDLVTGKGVVQ